MQRSRIQASQPSFLIPAWLALLVATALLALYGAMAADASWEVEVTRWIKAASPDALQAVAEFMTLIGRSPISFVVPATAVLALWLFGQRRLAAFLILAAFARMMSPAVKSLVDSPIAPGVAPNAA